MERDGLLARWPLRSVAASDSPWSDAVDLALRAVAAVICAANLVSGLAIVLSVTNVDRAPVVIGLALVIQALVGMIVVLAQVRRRPWVQAALVAEVCLGIAIALPVTNAGSAHLANNWWPTQFLLCTIVFVIVTDHGWMRLIPLGAVVAFHVVARTATWDAQGMPREFLALLLAVELGQVAYLASLALLSQAVLVRAARFSDGVHASVVDERERAADEQPRERVVREVERFVHDEVIHTLRTIAMDRVSVPAAHAIASAARLDAITSTGALPPSGTATSIVDRLEAAAERSPLDVVVKVKAGIVIPADVEDALVRAAMEALRNVSKHARASRAVVEVTRTGLTVHVTVTDDGVGFDADAPTTRRGVRSSIRQRMTEVGGGALITSKPGDGTTVHLSWTPRRTATERWVPGTGFSALEDFYPAATLVVIPFLAVTLWSAIWISPYLAHPWAGWVGSLGLVVTGALAALRAPRSGLPGWASLALTVVAWSASALNGWALPDGTEIPLLYWTAGSAAGVLVLQALFRPRWEMVVAGVGLVLVAAVACVVRAGVAATLTGFLACVLSPALALAAALVLRLFMDEFAWQILLAEEDSIRAHANRAARSAFEEEFGRRLRHLRQLIAGFVHDVATGALDVADESVRTTADLLERNVRDQMLPNVTEDLQEMVAGLRARGVLVTMRVAADVPQSVQRHGVAALESLEGAARPAKNGGTSATITIMRAGDRWRVSLMVPTPHRDVRARLEAFAGSAWDVYRDPDVIHLTRDVPPLVDSRKPT